MQQQKKKTEKTGKSILSWTHLDYRAGLWRNMFPSDTGDWHFRFVIRPVNLFCLTYLIFFFFFFTWKTDFIQLIVLYALERLLSGCMNFAVSMSSSPHGSRRVLPLYSNELRAPLQGLDQLRYFQKSMLAMKYSYSFPKWTHNLFI